MVALADHVVVVAAVGQVFRLAHDSQLTLVWLLHLLPLVVLPLPLRLLLLLLAACPKRSCHVSRQLGRQSARCDACGRFTVAKFLEQGWVLIVCIF